LWIKKIFSKLDKCHETMQTMEKQKAAQEQIIEKTENDIKRFEGRREKLMADIEKEKEKVNYLISINFKSILFIKVC
jgi:hypothetical protein